MCATFTDDDLDKPVENDNGDEVGVVAAVEGDVARVRPDPTVVDSIKSSLGWEKGAEERIALDLESVREITDDAIRLEGDLPIQGDSAADGGPERDETDRTEDGSRGAAVDPTERADRDAGLSVRPDDSDQRTDAAVDVDDDTRRTDAAVETDEDTGRTDAAVDPDALRETRPTDRGPTTEDGARGLEDGPETESLTDADTDEGEDE